MEQSTRRCDNLACICDIPFAQATCGDHCAGAKPEEIRCECGHSKCAQEMEAELSGSMGNPTH